MIEYKICKRCIMDTTAIDINFDEKGNCNYCNDLVNYNKKSYKKNIDDLIYKIKKNNSKNEYDCIVGLSGGVDSAWTLVKVLEYGLKPLAVHMDNGWNTELAQNNIHNLVKSLNVDLYTEVLDWDKYSSLMKSFFSSDVIDIELLYDNAMFASNFMQANKYNVKFILAGTNNSTEGLRIPKKWNWYKYDKKNIKDINSKFENIKLENYPKFSTFDYIYSRFIKNVKWISFLDYIDYNKFDAEAKLVKDYDFKPYLYKHYESFFTKFYQSYILPVKFNVDKRRVHLSSLIISGQISREEALKNIDKKPYNQETLNDDFDYFLKKMSWSKKDFQEYLNRPAKNHDFYKSELYLWEFATKLYNFIK